MHAGNYPVSYAEGPLTQGILHIFQLNSQSNTSLPSS